MAELLNQSDTYWQIDYIVRRARKFIVLISPFVNFYELYTLLKNRKPGVYTQIFVYLNDRYDPSEEEALIRIQVLHNVSLYAFRKPTNDIEKKFHCKCYFNETRFLLSSMNLTWIKNNNPHYNNLEYSTLLYKLKDKKLYFQAIEWYCKYFRKNIIGSKQEVSDLFNHIPDGHCTRCGVTIMQDINRHYCYDCYKRIRYRNIAVLNYCHICGQPLESNDGYIMHKECSNKRDV